MALSPIVQIKVYSTDITLMWNIISFPIMDDKEKKSTPANFICHSCDIAFVVNLLIKAVKKTKRAIGPVRSSRQKIK
jgi:hypothetical protein